MFSVAIKTFKIELIYFLLLTEVSSQAPFTQRIISRVLSRSIRCSLSVAFQRMYGNFSEKFHEHIHVRQSRDALVGHLYVFTSDQQRRVKSLIELWNRHRDYVKARFLLERKAPKKSEEGRESGFRPVR